MRVRVHDVRASVVKLTIGVGGDAGSVCGWTGSVAVDCKYANRVLRELIEPIHLVIESVHLHALKQETQPSVSSPRAEPSMILISTQGIRFHHDAVELTCSLPEGLSVQSSL